MVAPTSAEYLSSVGIICKLHADQMQHASFVTIMFFGLGTALQSEISAVHGHDSNILARTEAMLPCKSMLIICT